MKFYEVGGCVRDELLGIKSKDIDFVVVDSTYDELKDYLKSEGFKIYKEHEEHYTIRASIPKGHRLAKRAIDADFVLARKDGPTKDGRRPKFVKPGSLKDDLKRRDFTINSIAKSVDNNEIIDYFGGVRDLEKRILRFVGDPLKRIEEDGLRVLRAWRFQITKGLDPTAETRLALMSKVAEDMLGCVDIDRIREELEKMFSYDSLKSMNLIAQLNGNIQRAIFRDGLWLRPSLKKRRKK